MKKSVLLVLRPVAAKILEISLRTFARLEAEEVVVPHTVGRGGRASRYDVMTLVPAYLRHRERKREESPRDRRDRSQAELNELRIDRERKLLLPREQVVREGQMQGKAVAAKLRAIPSRLERAGAIPATAQTIVDELIREALDEMSRWSNELDLLRAIDEEKKGKGKEKGCTVRRRSPTGRAPTRRRRS